MKLQPKMRAVVIDDEENDRRALIGMMQDAGIDEYIEIVAEAQNGVEGLKAVLKEKPQIVFTDIFMPGMMGYQLVESIADENYVFAIVFTSAFSEQYEKNVRSASDLNFPYTILQKPLSMSDIETKCRKIYDKWLGTKPQVAGERTRIKVRSTDVRVPGEIILETKDIAWINSKKGGKNNIAIYTDPYVEYQKHITMTEMLEILRGEAFVQVHESYIVNEDKITGFDRQATEILIGKQIIPVSRRHKNVFNDLVQRCK
jgi:two-component system, LytTR family, response regulator